jgi:uncharacterized membrane protein YccC
MWQQDTRLRKVVAPDWLTYRAPQWLVAAVRPRRAPVPWANMVRAVIAICVPTAVGIAADRRGLGLLMAMGGLVGVIADRGGPYLARVKKVSSAVLGGAVGLAIGSVIHDRGWIAVVALVVVAGVSALLSSISDVGSVAGLQLMLYASLGIGPVGALRPWWHTALGFVLGAVWALILTVPGWLHSPRAAEQRSVAAVYRALARLLRTIGTDSAEARHNLTAALNAAYDTLLTARATAGGRNQQLTRLMAVLNEANPVAEATTTLNQAGIRPPPQIIGTVDRLAAAVEDGTAPPVIPPLPGTSPGVLALRDGLAGAAAVLSRNWAPPEAYPAAKPPLRERLGAAGDRLSGRLSRNFTLRLMACVGVAGVISEVAPVQRSYWVVLAVVVVLKPDFGSVFARAVQRGMGTIIGAVLGAVVLAVVPYGPWLLLPFGILAALLPYGRSRNYGLMTIFLTPLVVVLVDLLAAGGWRLAADRLLDTLLGCGIVLLIGYAPWPASWQAHLPGQFASAIRDVCRYMQEALVTAWAGRRDTAAPGADGASAARPDAAVAASPEDAARLTGGGQTRLPARSRLRRQAYRALADLRTEFERTMAEPQPVSRRATAWWPALVGLEEVMEAVTAAAIAISRGAPPPRHGAVRQLTAALGAVADAVQDDKAPPAVIELPSEESLKPVTESVRAVLGVLIGRKEPPPANQGPPHTTGSAA